MIGLIVPHGQRYHLLAFALFGGLFIAGCRVVVAGDSEGVFAPLADEQIQLVWSLLLHDYI